MFKILIKRENAITNAATFDTMLKLDSWFEQGKVNGSFGKNAHDETLGDGTAIQHEAEYTVEISDITLQVEQEKINTEALEYLQKTDFMVLRDVAGGVACTQEVKELRAAARLRIVR